LVDQSPHATRQALENDISQSAPPLYGDHLLDQLYSDVDPSGYGTPRNLSTIPGNFSIPGSPYSHSCNISDENLASLEAINGPGISISPEGYHVSPDALQHRLQNLRFDTITASSPPAHEDHSPENVDSLQPNARSLSQGGDYFSSNSSSSHHSRGPSPPWTVINGAESLPGNLSISRRPSSDDSPQSGARTPRARFFHAEDLSRLPSYSAAVRTPPIRIGSSNTGLPSYTATTAISCSSGLAVPESTYVRDRDWPAQATRTVITLHDEERRLWMLQARGCGRV
jgi:arrestin-related trafficking adapter 4/5/7